MKIYNLPIIIVYFSLLLSIFSGLFAFQLAYYSVLILILAFLSMSQITNFLNYSFSTNAGLIYYPLIISILIIQFFMQKGFIGFDCGFSFILYSILFSTIMLVGHTRKSLHRYTKIVENIYKILIVLLLVEFIFILLNKQYLLIETFSSYRKDNRSDIFFYFDLLSGRGALNSIFFGRQIAGMITLFALILFLELKYYKKIRTCIWLILTALLFIASATAIIFFLAIITLIIYAFFSFIKKRKASSGIFIIFLSITLGLLFEFLIGKFYSRIFSTDLLVLNVTDPGKGLSNYDYYVFQFSNPLLLFVKGDFLSLLFGFPSDYLVNSNIYVSGDFSLAFNALRGGIISVFMFIIFLLKYPLIFFVKKNKVIINLAGPFYVKLRALAIISLLYLLSYSHYASQTAVIFFAFQYAVLIYGINAIKSPFNIKPYLP